MSRRNGMKLVYVGDVGVITPPTYVKPIPPDVDIWKLELRELFNLGVKLGYPVTELLGVSHCWDHLDYVKLGGNKLPDGYNWAEHVIYCKNCWEYFRVDWH